MLNLARELLFIINDYTDGITRILWSMTCKDLYNIYTPIFRNSTKLNVYYKEIEFIYETDEALFYMGFYGYIDLIKMYTMMEHGREAFIRGAIVGNQIDFLRDLCANDKLRNFIQRQAIKLGNHNIANMALNYGACDDISDIIISHHFVVIKNRCTGISSLDISSNKLWCGNVSNNMKDTIIRIDRGENIYVSEENISEIVSAALMNDYISVAEHFRDFNMDWNALIKNLVSYKSISYVMKKIDRLSDEAASNVAIIALDAHYLDICEKLYKEYPCTHKIIMDHIYESFNTGNNARLFKHLARYLSLEHKWYLMNIAIAAKYTGMILVIQPYLSIHDPELTREYFINQLN